MRKFMGMLGAGLAIALVASTAVGAGRSTPKSSAAVKRGEYLVTIGGCNDCHTPWKMGPKGPELDMSRMLSGHPETLQMPEPPQGAPPWGVSAALTNTAWSGPWGTSFTANLTPDPETGLGKWTLQNFTETMRSGRHQGRGRPILPPMPWFNYGKMTDEDLKATFAYLQSIPAIRNRVPDPIVSQPGASEQASGGEAPPAPGQEGAPGGTPGGARQGRTPPPGR